MKCPECDAPPADLRLHVDAIATMWFNADGEFESLHYYANSETPVVFECTACGHKDDELFDEGHPLKDLVDPFWTLVDERHIEVT